ncbi:MAG: outer membrane beta-barrel protein [Albidovulum sp.]
MNIMAKTLVGAVVSGMMAVPALAGSLAEPIAEAPVIAPVAPVNYGGDWTGGYVGAQLGYGDVSATGLDGDGLLYGLRGGYDWDLGNWVVGAGVDWDKTDIDLGTTAGDQLDSVARLKLRAGYDLGQTLVYGTAGAARAKADIGGVSRSDNGWFAGIGAEYALTDQWSVGGEILTHQFNDFDSTGIDVDATTATVNVGFRF